MSYLNSNVVMLKWMIAQGYKDVRSITRRIKAMQEWLDNPRLLEADTDAEYAAVIDIDLAEDASLLLCEIVVFGRAAMGERIRRGVIDGLQGNPGLKEIRGQGLMIGIELDRPCGELLLKAAQAGLLISVTADTVIRLLPPLIIGETEIAAAVERIDRACARLGEAAAKGSAR